MSFYRRHIEVELTSTSGESKTFIHDSETGELFRIDFETDFTGNGIVKLYNVLQSTIKMCNFDSKKRSYAKCKLVAGYRTDVSVLMNGDIINSVVSRSGADRILELKISPKVDSLNELAKPKNYNGTWQSILYSILVDNGISYFEILTDNGKTEIVDQFIVTGTLKETLQKICKYILSEMYFETGKLIIASKDNKKVRDSEVIVLGYHYDSDSGMQYSGSSLIGSPLSKGSLLSAKALLNPRIAKNKKVEINYIDTSKEEKITHDYIVRKGKHIGSSWANEYYTEFECAVI